MAASSIELGKLSKQMSPSSGSSETLEYGGKSAHNYCKDTIQKSSKNALVSFSFIAGIVHLIWYNTFLQITPYLEKAIPGWQPSPIWLPAGTIGSIVGSIYFFTRKEPIKLSMKFNCCIGIAITAFACLMIMIGTYYGSLSTTACTWIVAVLFFACEIMRGIIQCSDFGVTVYYDVVGMCLPMSIAVAVGEGVSGIVPWFTLLLLSFSGLDTNDGFFISVCITCGVSLAVTLSYLINFHITFKHRSNYLLTDIFHDQKKERIEREARQRQQGIISGNRYMVALKAIKGTKFTGLALAIVFAASLNIYPQVFPFGYAFLSLEDTTVILGIFTCLDPIFRFSGFYINKLLKVHDIHKSHMMISAIIFAFIWLGFGLVPYYQPDNTWFNQFWQCIIFIVFFGIAHGVLVVSGIHCYMSNLLNTPYSELSGGLVVLYIDVGVCIGQLTYLIYPSLL